MRKQFEFDILGTKWNLNIGELARNELGAKQFGLMDAEAREITINHKTDPSWRFYLLLHEVLHALSYLGHLQFLKHEDFPEHDDEAKVDAIASLLSEVLTRNGLVSSSVLDIRAQEGGESDPSRQARLVSPRGPYGFASVAESREP